jgi:uncharacterized protein YndB with AHSA1/START domain
MKSELSFSEFGVQTEPATFKIQRRLSGTIERVWAYLTDSDLRSKWLAAGDMAMAVGAPFELVWRNDLLTVPPDQRPQGFPAEQRMQSQITECDPPRKLAFKWGETGSVSIALEPDGNGVVLTLVHRNLPDRAMTLMVGAGWHMHLDILSARTRGENPPSFWDGWSRLRSEYDQRLTA